jgi:hypothetical protein
VKLQYAVKYTAIDDGIWTVQDNKKPAKLEKLRVCRLLYIL